MVLHFGSCDVTEMQIYAVIPAQKGTVDYPGAWAPVIVSGHRQSFQSSLDEKRLSSRTGCTGSIPIHEIIQVTREALLYILPYIFNVGQGKMQKKDIPMLELRDYTLCTLL